MPDCLPSNCIQCIDTQCIFSPAANPIVKQNIVLGVC